jgi:hypothetical protein
METELLNNLRQEYFCKICDYKTDRNRDYKRHILSGKHQKNEKNAKLETLGNGKFAPMFHCENCDYYCDNKSSYTKHLTTEKHIHNITNVNHTTVEDTKIKILNCEVCNKEFMNKSGLWKHKKKCFIREPNVSTHMLDDSIGRNTIKDTNIPMDLILEVIKQSKEIQNVLIEQTKELQAKLLEKENQLLEQGEKLLEKENKLLEKEDIVIDQQKQLIEMAKKPNMINSNNNNQFNLNFFLNETCKNAMNIQDFISSIKLTTQDFETTGKIGFVDGISRIFINELKRIEVERRPLHCTDVKRETVYVKDNDTWEKENQEKKKLKWAINSIAQLNLNQVQDWQQEYPECRENNTVANTHFNKMAMVALGGFGDVEEAKFRDKIMKNVLKEIVVSKEIE